MHSNYIFTKKLTFFLIHVLRTWAALAADILVQDLGLVWNQFCPAQRHQNV